MSLVSIALVHHPILDRQGAIITTAITNLDLHDMARSSCAYGLSSFFIVHPVEAQRELALRIKSHWTSGSGSVQDPDARARDEAAFEWSPRSTMCMRPSGGARTPMCT